MNSLRNFGPAAQLKKKVSKALRSSRCAGMPTITRGAAPGASRTVQRRYRAFASGVTHPEGSVGAPIGRNPNNRKLMAVVPGGKAV